MSLGSCAKPIYKFLLLRCTQADSQLMLNGWKVDKNEQKFKPCWNCPSMNMPCYYENVFLCECVHCCQTISSVHPASPYRRWYKDDLCALAFKVLHDKQRGPLVFLRIYSGILKPQTAIHNINRNSMYVVFITTPQSWSTPDLPSVLTKIITTISQTFYFYCL